MKIPIRRMPDQPDYSLILLELMVLTACIRIIGAKRMFEFGTFLGNTTLHMAMNSPVDAVIWTLDTDDETLERYGLLETYSWRRGIPLEFADSIFQGKITTLHGDSRTFYPGSLKETMDLVVIDGDHSGKGVTADTVNAWKLLKPRGNTCIAWHDYRTDPGCAENVAFLEKLSDDVPLVHIEDTALVILLRIDGKNPLV